MSVSPQTIWALLLLTGCVLPCAHVARLWSVRLDVRVTVAVAGLVALTCAYAAAIHAPPV
jgi:hypothetical protein